MFVRVFFLLWFFLALAEAANAGPLIAAIGAAITGIQAAIAASPIFGMIFKTVIGLGMSLLQQALNKQKNKPSLVGTTLEIKMGDDQPMTFPVGARAVAGRRKYIGSWGEDGKTPNAYLTDVIEISNLPSNAGPLGMTSLWVGQQKCGVLFDQPHPDGRGYPVQQFIHPNGKRFMWIKYYDGTQTSADPFLMAKFGGHPTRPYTGERIGRGCQYIILTTLIDNDLQLGGSPPDVLVEPHPTPMYDPRKDSTNGGSGNHRYGNWSTYEPTLNPMVIAYNICRGIYYTPSEWVFGGQAIEPVQLPNSAWFAAMNECDRDNGSGVAQYRCGLEVQCDQDPTDVIEALRVACAGRISESGGIIKPLVGAPGAAVYSFDDSGVIVTEEQDFLPFPSLKSTHNGIAGTYPEPNQRWAVTDAPEQRNPDQEAADGGRWLPAAIRFDAVPFTQQVQHLMKTLAAEQRRFRVHMITLPPSAWPLEPNDVVAWTSARNGYTNKKFIITAISGTAGMLLHVTLLEIDPTDYDPPTIYVPAPNGWIGPITVPSQPMTGWAVEPSTIKDAGGIDRRPAIKISCAQELEDVIGVWVQVRLKETGDVVFDSDSNPYASPYSWIISGQWMLANKDYEARGRYLPQSNRPTDWSAWLTVKTPNVLINAADIFDGAIIQSKIADAAVTADKIMSAAVTSLKLADQAVSTAKLQVAAVTADVLASNAVIASKLADGAVTARALAQGAVDATALASGIKAVEVVNALPTTGNAEGRQVFLTTDGKLYRYHNGAWTAAVAAGDVNGTLNSAQIADNAITSNKLAALAVDASKLADGTIVPSKIADGAITNSKLAALAIDATKLADSAITVTKIADGAISTPKLQANAITADKIAAGAITAKQLVLTDFSNIADNGWQQGTLDGWPFKEPVDAFYKALDQGDASGWILRSRGRDCAYSNPVACSAGEVYYFDAWVLNTDAANANLYGVLYNPDGSFGTWLVVQGTAVKNQWVRLKGQLTVPSGYARIGMLLQVDKVPGAGALCYWSKPVMRRASSAELIVDGAITAAKIAANAITADKIAANAILAKNIVLQDWENLVPNGQWEDVVSPPTDYYTLQGEAGGTLTWVTDAANALSGKTYMRLSKPVAAATSVFVNGTQIPVGSNATLYWEVFYKTDVATNAGLFVRILWFDGNKQALQPYDAPGVGYTDLLSNGGGAAAWSASKGQTLVPGAAKFMVVQFINWVSNTTAKNFDIGRIVIRRANAASLIVDGSISGKLIAAQAITADKMAANSITAGTIAANAVTAGTIAAGAVSAAQIAAGAITADKIAAGSISADKLAVGSGKNLIINSDWSAGTTNWAPEWSNEPNSFSWGMRYDGYAPRGGTIEIYQKNGNQAEYGIGQVNADGSARYVNVVGGRWYEFSGLYYGHRCNGMIAYVQWLTGDLQHIGYGAVGSPTNASQNGFPNWSVGSYQQYFGMGQAPANAALARVFLRMKGTIAGQSDSYLWLYQVYFGEGVANQSAASKWSDGLSTLISGGNIVTGSVTADKIATNAVTAGKIAAGAVTAGTIAAGAVTAATIAGGSITGDKIAANTIGANQIAAGAITAKSLILTDFSNMVDNGWQGGNLDGWTVQNLQNFYFDGSNGDWAGYVVQSLARDCCTSKTIAVTPGETYAFDVWVYNTDPNTANILVMNYAGNGAITYGFVTQTATKNGWIRLQGRYTIPSGCVKIAMLLQVDKTTGTGGSCYWSKPVMRRATSGELIVDGAITGNKIAANAITAAQIATNAITTDKLILAGVTIDKIAPGAVTAMNAGRVGDLQVIGSGTTINLAAVGIAVDGDSRVMINAMSLGQYGQNNNGKDAQPIGCNIWRNGLAIFSQTYYLGVVQSIVSVSGGGSSGGAGQTTTQTTYTAGLVGVPALYDAPGPGYHVYTFQLYVPPGNNIGWRETNIVATAFKR